MKKKLSVMNAKTLLYVSDILDAYGDGNLQILYISEDKTRTVCRVTHKTGQYIFKSVSCPIASADDIKLTEKEYQISKEMYSHTHYIAKPMDMKKVTDNSTNETYIEMLYEYGGESLATLIGKLDVTLLLDIAAKMLEPLSIMEANGIFHSDIKPDNIVIKDGIVKIIDFGIARDFTDKTVLFRMSKSLDDKMIGGTAIYLPPELINMTKEYSLNKVDVYCWGMTIYQLVTGKSSLDLGNEMEIYKKAGRNYNGFLAEVRGIKLAGDPDGQFTKWIIDILLQVLDARPEKRPTFASVKSMFDGLNIGKIAKAEEVKSMPAKMLIQIGGPCAECQKLQQEKIELQTKCKEEKDTGKREVDRIATLYQKSEQEKNELRERFAKCEMEKSRI